MPDRDTDLIGQLAALVVAAYTRDSERAGAVAGEIGSRLGLVGQDADVGVVHAALRTALRFDPVALAEISEMTGETAQNINYLMGASTSPPPPSPVRLARMKVWRRSEVVVWWASIGREVFWTDEVEPG